MPQLAYLGRVVPHVGFGINKYMAEYRTVMQHQLKISNQYIEMKEGYATSHQIFQASQICLQLILLHKPHQVQS